MGRSDLPVVGEVGVGSDAASVQGRLSEVGVIESIEELSPELEIDALVDLQVLDGRDIPKVKTGAMLVKNFRPRSRPIQITPIFIQAWA